jgi:hypothetical protein
LRATINATIIALPRHRILILIVAHLSSSLSRYKTPRSCNLHPDYRVESIKAKAFRPPKDWSNRGQMSRIILSVLRQAAEPLTTRDIALHHAQRHDLRPAAVLTPSHFPGIGRQLRAGDVMVNADLGTAQTGEKRLRLVGAGFAIRASSGSAHAAYPNGCGTAVRELSETPLHRRPAGNLIVGIVSQLFRETADAKAVAHGRRVRCPPLPAGRPVRTAPRRAAPVMASARRFAGRTDPWRPPLV